jgi:hypothetical protein
MTRTSNARKKILFEGISEGEILALPAEDIDGLVLTGRPIVFRAGSATVLGEFRREAKHLVIELAHIDGGGEGVLISLGSLAKRYARLHRIEAVEWIVHAVNCAKPNLKLRRVLERRGFSVCDVPGTGAAYYLLDSIVCVEAEKPKAAPRAGWAEASRELAAHGDDQLVWPEFANEGDAELTW